MAECIKCRSFNFCPWAIPPEIICSQFQPTTQTNADRIRAMTGEELAEWLERIRVNCANDLCGRNCPLGDICYSKADTPTETLDWLKEEIE